MSRILSGTEVKKQILAELNQEIVKLKNRNVIPTLVIIQIGDNSASNTYVKNKIKLSEQIGTVTILKKFSESFSENELLSLIDNLNDDKSINGIILQLPIPKHINEEKILSAISPEKDVDCFNIVNIGKL
jgi:methylenetetrahydrofolate dehydrogenase (NADP+)/methenyltetrahydrofolate cyclohydrolase